MWHQTWSRAVLGKPEGFPIHPLTSSNWLLGESILESLGTNYIDYIYQLYTDDCGVCVSIKHTARIRPLLSTSPIKQLSAGLQGCSLVLH